MKHADGAIEGPYPVEELVSMIGARRLQGSEGVSKDDALWIPIMAVPVFAAEFRRAQSDENSLFGGLDAGPPRTSTQLLSPLVAEETKKFDAAELLTDRMGRGDLAGRAGGGRTQPLGDPFGGGLGEASGPFGIADARLGMQTSEESVAKSVVTDADALTGVSGVRRISGERDPGMSELPLGFGGPPPVRPRTESTTGLPQFESADLPAARELLPPGDLSELPGLVGGDNLPASARAGLPGTVAGLPRSAGSNLPGLAGGLPQSAGGLPGLAGGLPGSAGGLPGSAGGLPSSATGLPLADERSGAPRPGTQMMTGIGFEEDLPTTTQKPVGHDLPASARGGATAILEDLGDLDGLFAGPGGVVPGQEQSRDVRQAGATFGASLAADDGVFEDDPFADMEFGGGGAPAGATRDAFFDAAEPVAAEADRVLPDAAEPVPAADRRKAPKRPLGPLVAKVLGGVAAAGLVVGGGFLIVSMMEGGEQEEVIPVATTPREEVVRPVVTATLESIEALRDGSWVNRLGYIEQGRSVVAAGGTPEDRAHLAIALLLNVVERPSQAEDYAEAQSLLEGVESDAEVVALARGALLAAAGSEDAERALGAFTRGDLGAWAGLFVATTHLQQWRGVLYDEPAMVEVVEEPEGSGEEGVAEPAAASPPPVQMALSEERTLSPEMARALDRALALDSGLVTARWLRGWTALEQGDPEAAARQFELAIELNAQHIPSWNGLALARLAEGQLADADARIQRVIDEMGAASAPHERSATFLTSARISIARLQPQLAIESLLSALQEDASNQVALRLLGEQFYRAEQYPRAIEYFQPLADAPDPSVEVVVALTQSLIGVGLLNDAQARLEAALARYTSEPRIPFLLGQVLEKRVEFGDASDMYRQSMQIDPGFVEAYIQLAKLEERGGNPGGALTLLDDASSLDIRVAELASGLGDGYLSIGERNKAVAAYRRALRIDPSYPDARIALTEFYLDNGQNERAIRELDHMVASGVDSPRVRFLHARALTAQGNYDRAIEELLGLIEQDSSNAEYLMLMGQSHFYSGNVETGRTFFVRALDASAGDQEAQYFIGRSDLERGALNEAIAALTAVAQRSTRGDFHYWLGRALEHGGQNAQALSEYTAAIDNDIAWSLEEPDVFYRRGRIYHRRGAHGASYRDLRVLLTLRPQHAAGAWTMGQYYFDQQQYARAIQMMELSLSVNAEQPNVAYWLARSYLALPTPDLSMAVQYFEQARDGGFGSTQTDLLRRLGYVYRDTGRRPDAIASFRSYLEIPTLAADDRREVENEIRRLGGTPN